jgi:hypothetical protein
MRKGIQHGIQRWWFRYSRRGIRAQRAMGALRTWWRGQVCSAVCGVAGWLAPIAGMAQRRSRQVQRQRGAVTAEYAIAMLAAVGFAGLLVVTLRGDEVRGLLTDMVRNALSTR